MIDQFGMETGDRGYLQVSTFSTDEGRPVPNAAVKIAPTAEPELFFEEIYTDESGQSQVISLPAPPLDYSLEPGAPKPYTEYNIMVTLEGFADVEVFGVQILPNELALQNINLKPDLNLPEVQDFLIEEHTLWGIFPPKIPEEEVKPLPPSEGFVVLPNPVIPEFIIVHDGVPSDPSAPNYWIPYKDYIKNVACCEIYSTWPEEAIIANVLAINSFTLNRVYTEWYRGKGYDFTITSSTAYDQAFVFKRNIFEKVSFIVDRMFTSFVTRPNIRQPLFTQYCDGSRVSCPGWLSQWGSKTLGEQGYYAVDILKNYYGQDIYLMQAERVSGVPISFPGTPLQEGSRGEAVRTIQQQLNAISNNYPAINKIAVDGVYGDKTREAVETFQEVFNLPPTGIVDFATWYQISHVFVAVERIAELN